MTGIGGGRFVSSRITLTRATRCNYLRHLMLHRVKASAHLSSFGTSSLRTARDRPSRHSRAETGLLPWFASTKQTGASRSKSSAWLWELGEAHCVPRFESRPDSCVICCITAIAAERLMVMAHTSSPALWCRAQAGSCIQESFEIVIPMFLFPIGAYSFSPQAAGILLFVKGSH